jgi:hypothetical protein
MSQFFEVLILALHPQVCFSLHIAPALVDIHREFMTAAAMYIMLEKLLSVLSLRMAMRLYSLSLQKKFSIKCRHLYISLSISSGSARLECWEMAAFAPR